MTPTPEVTKDPNAAPKRGGKIFLYFGLAALAVGAVAVGTILLLDRRAEEKEAYNYKNSTKRRK